MGKELYDLLNEVRVLAQANSRLKKERMERGDAFNLFEELGMSYSEVTMHSAFLAMLLSPHSSHGQKGKYLDLFIKMLDKKMSMESNPFGMNSDEASTMVEKSIGAVDGEHGGRLDIYIKDDCGHRIIIENKINANDQPYQMKRYWNFAQEECNKDKSRYRLVYLTLDGHEPSKASTCGLKADEYICLSYKLDIVPWLEKCVAKSVRLPLIRETINQYIDVLKKITFSDMENTNEVLQAMSKEEYLDAVFAIAKNFNPMIDNIMNNILYPQLLGIAESNGLQLKFETGAGWMNGRYNGWTFVNPNWRYFNISMEFESSGLGNLIIGFHVKSGVKRENVQCWETLWERTTALAPNNLYWIYVNFPKYVNWNTPDSLKAITDGKTMKAVISDAIADLLKAAEGLDV